MAGARAGAGPSPYRQEYRSFAVRRRSHGRRNSPKSIYLPAAGVSKLNQTAPRAPVDAPPGRSTSCGCSRPCSPPCEAPRTAAAPAARIRRQPLVDSPCTGPSLCATRGRGRVVRRLHVPIQLARLDPAMDRPAAHAQPPRRFRLRLAAFRVVPQQHSRLHPVHRNPHEPLLSAWWAGTSPSPLAEQCGCRNTRRRDVQCRH